MRKVFRIDLGGAELEAQMCYRPVSRGTRVVVQVGLSHR